MASELQAHRYDPSHERSWQDVLAHGHAPTVFHDRHFLAYHGARFADTEHSLIFADGDAAIALLPLVVEGEAGARVARSPFGASVGGPVFRLRGAQHGGVSAARARAVITAVIAQFQAWQVSTARITMPPSAWALEPDDTFAQVLREMGFASAHREMHSLVPLGQLDARVHARVGRNARKAERAAIRIEHHAPTPALWQVMDATFAKHGARPTHTPHEWEWLRGHLSDRITNHVAWMGDVPVAAIGEMTVAPGVRQSFYLAHDPAHQDTQALTLLVLRALQDAQDAGCRWYDFGTSTDQGVVRPGVLTFKESFGAIGQFRETFVWQRGTEPLPTD